MTLPKNSENMCILVMSCDKYADCWIPFSMCIQKYWPDCTFPVYLATETLSTPANTVFKKTFHSNNFWWTARVREACQKIEEPYILFVLEDQWLSKKLQTSSIQEILAMMQRDTSLGTVYLDYSIKHKTAWNGNTLFSEIPAGVPYRLSAGPSIWRRDFLLTALAEDADAWNFERVQSFSPATYNSTVLASNNAIYSRVPPLGAIRRGKWEPSIPKFARENNLPIDFSIRKTITCQEQIQVALKSFIFNLNPSLIVNVQNHLYNWNRKRKKD